MIIFRLLKQSRSQYEQKIPLSIWVSKWRISEAIRRACSWAWPYSTLTSSSNIKCLITEHTSINIYLDNKEFGQNTINWKWFSEKKILTAGFLWFSSILFKWCNIFALKIICLLFSCFMQQFDTHRSVSTIISSLVWLSNNLQIIIRKYWNNSVIRDHF